MIKIETREDLIIKRKRTKRPRQLSPLSLTMATTSCSTGSPTGGGKEEEDMANCLILLAQSCNQKSSSPEKSIQETKHNKASFASTSASTTTVITDKDFYQCKTCNRRFHSFQALGGHRASHKKSKPPASSTTLENQESSSPEQLREEQSTILSLQIPTRDFSCTNTSNTKQQRVHACSICGAEFNSGQALGGHMRRHRPIPIVPSNTKEEEFPLQVKKKQRTILSLDLNLPAPDEDDQIMDAKFPFPAKEQVIVFSASPLVECHY